MLGFLYAVVSDISAKMPQPGAVIKIAFYETIKWKLTRWSIEIPRNPGQGL